MRTPEDLRASERIPIDKKVKVGFPGRKFSLALAVNISLGGLLLTAAPTLPVGSTCKLAILLTDGGGAHNVLREGTVIRSDAQGTAIRFATALDQSLLGNIVASPSAYSSNTLLDSYISYFKVSQSSTYAGSERLLGVSGGTFKKVFQSTFYTCVPLAVLPVWAFHASLPAAPNWVKVLAAFCYALIVFALIQPLADLAIFKVLRKKKLSKATT